MPTAKKPAVPLAKVFKKTPKKERFDFEFLCICREQLIGFDAPEHTDLPLDLGTLQCDSCSTDYPQAFLIARDARVPRGLRVILGHPDWKFVAEIHTR